MRRLLLAAVAASLLAAVSAGSRVAVGTLAGTVVDASGHPVTGAAVTIESSDGLEPFATHTDSQGNFRMARLEIGEYDVRASSAGLISNWIKRIMVHANKTTEVTLSLPAARS